MIRTAALTLCALAGPASAQLVVANDQASNPTLWLIDATGNGNPPRALVSGGTPGVGWGAAADEVRGVLYWNNGQTLYKAAYTPAGPLTPVTIGPVLYNNTSPTALAFDPTAGGGNPPPGALYARVPAGIVAVNVETGETTLVWSNANQDFGGIDYDPVTDAFYALNDSASAVPPLAGRGIYRLDKPLGSSVTRIADYPAGEFDIDGLAAGNGRLYLVNDAGNQPIFVYNLGTNAYETSLGNPVSGTTGVLMAAGAWAPGLVPPNGTNTRISVDAPANCTAALGQQVTVTYNVFSDGPQPASNVIVNVDIPINTSFVSSLPEPTIVGDILTYSLGGMDAHTSRQIQVTFMLNTGTSAQFIADVNQSEPDIYDADNSDGVHFVFSPTSGGEVAARGVFTTITTASTSDVPGLPGAKFAAGITPGRPYRSLDGTKWVQTWDTNLATASDQIIMGFDGEEYRVLMREGVTPLPTVQGADPDLPPFYPFGSFDAVLGVDDNGTFAVTGIDDRSGSADDGYCVTGQIGQSGLNLIVQESITPLPGATDVFFGDPGSAQVSVMAGVSFQCGLTGNVTTADDNAIFTQSGAVTFAREGLDFPDGQRDGNTFTYRSFDAGSAQTGFFVSSSGGRWIAAATINDETTFDRVVVVDNVVKVQEGVVLANSGFTSPVGSTLKAVRMDPDGNWFVAASNQDGQDWVIRNKFVIAKSDEPIFAGAGEHFTDANFAATFFMMAGNVTGDYVVGGMTDSPDPLSDAVIVVNNERVLVRENDPVDLDDDGVFDDGYYIRTFVDDRCFMTQEHFYVLVRLRGAQSALCGAADADAGFALIRVPITPSVPDCDTIDFNRDGLFPDNVDLLDFLSVFSGGACTNDPLCGDLDFNNDGLFPDNLDLEAFFSVFGGGPCLR